jgi:hypothetical protein
MSRLGPTVAASPRRSDPLPGILLPLKASPSARFSRTCGMAPIAARVLQAALRYVVPAAIALATAAPLVLSAVGW